MQQSMPLWRALSFACWQVRFSKCIIICTVIRFVEQLEMFVLTWTWATVAYYQNYLNDIDKFWVRVVIITYLEPPMFCDAWGRQSTPLGSALFNCITPMPFNSLSVLVHHLLPVHLWTSWLSFTLFHRRTLCVSLEGSSLVTWPSQLRWRLQIMSVMGCWLAVCLTSLLLFK